MAERDQIVDALESLAVHCRAPLMAVDVRARWLADWCDDLKAFDIADIEAACRQWRQGDNTKFPTPGLFLPLVRKVSQKPVSTAALNNQAWSWPSDDMLAALTLAERRRAYLIMASEARAKAGAMRDDGTVPQPEFIKEAQRYLDEAKSLGDIIKSHRHAAE